jgi:hypothetical protein
MIPASMVHQRMTANPSFMCRQLMCVMRSPRLCVGQLISPPVDELGLYGEVVFLTRHSKVAPFPHVVACSDPFRTSSVSRSLKMTRARSSKLSAA